VSVKARVTTDE